MIKRPYAPLIITFVALLSMLVVPAPLAAGTVNVALQAGAVASQSSSYYLVPDPRFAIDGNLSDFTHTNNEQGAWWQVQLIQPYAIDTIVLWNREDCCRDRLSNFRLSVLNGLTEVWGADYYPTSGYPNPDLSIQPPAGTTGDIVRVQLYGSNYLSLGEVQVFSDVSDVPEPATMAMAVTGLLGLLVRRRF
jgi:hypothetical protein